ncbi:hypothetical protein O0L34_g3663 [Tuta absoluta]|nr:hypothetical protein O0L34_g3662 [Tuta absoluta]KAJ2941447.1 hypothetical protein O0L34_g3663 [Tuta absoluta]
MTQFLGIILIMGVVKLPEIRLYWSKNPIYENRAIKKTMARDRFLDKLKYWHFSEAPVNDDENNDRLHKIRQILTLMVTTFKSTVEPGKEVVIDESMVPWRGRLIFRQYIPNKTHKYGIKNYKICMPNGYTYNLEIYTGRVDDGSGQGHPQQVTMKLLDGLTDKGRILYSDNFYTGVPLAETLMEKKTFLCGTVRQNLDSKPVSKLGFVRGRRENNHKHLPKQAVKSKQRKGQVLALKNRNGVKYINWTDKRTVHNMLSTCNNHTGALVPKPHRWRPNTVAEKPDSVLDYNNAKKGVDVSDQMASYYTSLRKTLKWYRKLIIEIICGTMLVNAWVIHQKFGEGKKLSILEFRKRII